MLSLNPEQIKKLKNLPVSAIYLFGSQAQGVENALSDYDFGVLLEDARFLKNRKGRNQLYDNLLSIFEVALGHPTNIDIVFLDEADLVLKFHVLRFGKTLYLANPQHNAKFQETTLLEHADFEPYRRLFEETTFQRLGCHG